MTKNIFINVYLQLTIFIFCVAKLELVTFHVTYFNSFTYFIFSKTFGKCETAGRGQHLVSSFVSFNVSILSGIF